MKNVIIYTKANCPYCVHAKNLLSSKNINFSEIRIDLMPEKRDEMMKLSKQRTVPQIFIENLSIGGFDNLSVLNAQGELDKLLK
ncbi:MAG: grxC [Francisellaceae bacterium]|nr:grxC [Francisellaceae bacterium]